MTPRQRMLVQSTYEMAMPRLSMVSDRFYTRLLKRHPELRSLFKSDLRHLGRLFAQTFTLVVQRLEDSEAVETMLGELGQRHRQYGVEREHYELASKILISSVRLASGISFTYEIRKAWEAFYDYIIECMAPDTSAVASQPSRARLHQ